MCRYLVASAGRPFQRRDSEGVELPGRLSKIDPRLRQINRFFADVETELDEIEKAIRVVRRMLHRSEINPWRVDDLEDRMATMQTLDRRFGVLLQRLSDIEAARNRAYNSIGLFGVLLAALFVMLYLRQAARLERVAHDQRDRRRIALLTHRVQEDERRALARDLHGGTAQELAIARMATDRVNDDALRRMIEGSLTRAIDEIRFLARRLRPMPDSHDSPAEIIRELCDDFESRFGFRFVLDIDRRIHLDCGDDEVVHRYRIVQVSLSNIALPVTVFAAIGYVRWTLIDTGSLGDQYPLFA